MARYEISVSITASVDDDQCPDENTIAQAIYDGGIDAIFDDSTVIVDYVESMEEKTCFNCGNSFVDENDELHCMADGHNHEEIVADDHSCDDWN